MGVREYIYAVEEVIIGALSRFNIVGGRDERNRGVWVGNNKIAALGLRISRQTSMHGFALNVTTKLEDYGGIVPCGLSTAGVTSMSRILGGDPEMAEVKQAISQKFIEVFGYG